MTAEYHHDHQKAREQGIGDLAPLGLALSRQDGAGLRRRQLDVCGDGGALQPLAAASAVSG